MEGTNIIPSKTFLLKKRWQSLMKNEDDYFDLGLTINNFKEKGTPIRLIIDLT